MVAFLYFTSLDSLAYCFGFNTIKELKWKVKKNEMEK